MTMAAMCGKNSEGVRRLSGKRLFIYCAGGLGRDVLKMARYINRQQGRWEEVFFIDDHFTSGEMNNAPVIRFEKYLKQRNNHTDEFVIANGEAVYRKQIYQKLKESGCVFTNIVHPNVYLDEYDFIQDGAIITEGNVLGGNIHIGKCTYVSLACILGHDVVLEDFVTLSHDVNLSGSVHIGEGTYIGTGTVIRDEVTIGKNCIIGMGSLVTRDIPDNVVAYGSPCRAVRENTDGIVFR